MTREQAKELLPVITAWSDGKLIQIKTCGTWEDVVINPLFNGDPKDYRIKLTPTRVPLGPDDLPPVCWVRRTSGDNQPQLIVTVTPTQIAMGGLTGFGTITYARLMDDDWQYSETRKEGSWKPCWKEES